jgi:monoamine oxidase
VRSSLHFLCFWYSTVVVRAVVKVGTPCVSLVLTCRLTVRMTIRWLLMDVLQAMTAQYVGDERHGKALLEELDAAAADSRVVVAEAEAEAGSGGHSATLHTTELAARLGEIAAVRAAFEGLTRPPQVVVATGAHPQPQGGLVSATVRAQRHVAR